MIYTVLTALTLLCTHLHSHRPILFIIAATHPLRHTCTHANTRTHPRIRAHTHTYMYTFVGQFRRNNNMQRNGLGVQDSLSLRSPVMAMLLPSSRALRSDNLSYIFGQSNIPEKKGAFEWCICTCTRCSHTSTCKRVVLSRCCVHVSLSLLCVCISTGNLYLP